MFFKSVVRVNPIYDKLEGYYRLVESYRNDEGRPIHRTLLTIGFLKKELTPERLNKVQSILNDRLASPNTLFEETDAVVKNKAEELWQTLISQNKIDVVEDIIKTKSRQVSVDSLEHQDIRTIGSEWLCYQGLEQLGLSDFLTKLGFDETQIALTLTQIISRAVYPASELRTSKWIRENSAVTEITGYPKACLTKDKLYKNALELYKNKTCLENYLSRKTNELFDIEDKIILYDLTNTYFEGRKVKSQLADFGRSKEKRNDAKIVVLALVINVEGFIKFSSIFEGSLTDVESIPKIIDEIKVKTSLGAKKGIVIIDAGIASKANLALIVAKGYDYVCVSRSKANSENNLQTKEATIVFSKDKKKISLHEQVSTEPGCYSMLVESEGKRLKELSMNQQFEVRYLAELEKIKNSLSKKHQTKKAEKVQRRIGRAQQKYPSIARFYEIQYQSNGGQIITDISWKKKEPQYETHFKSLGAYIIKTSLRITDKEKLWKIYNSIREIEYCFRVLKNDLELRPIYHKNDSSTMAHLHLGLLAYWLVNTIRYQLKKQGINDSWKEILRKSQTQCMITTSGINQLDKIISVRKCSIPNKSLQTIYDTLKYKHRPFRKTKSVVHKQTFKKNETQQLRSSPPT